MIQQILQELLKSRIIILILITVNIITFLLMGYDKHEAKLKKWRVSEKTLFILAMLGGSLGGLSGMYVFHHKTQKAKFKYGFPIILLIQIILLGYAVTT